jgi:hypothetical protein
MKVWGKFVKAQKRDSLKTFVNKVMDLWLQYRAGNVSNSATTNF